jgi:Zn-dependent protease
MKNPLAIRPEDDVRQIGTVFGTPLVVKGRNWIPLAQLLTWLVLLRQARRKGPERPWSEQAGVAAASMAVLLGSEWSHNLAHAAAARAIGKPMDAMRIVWGMPLCVYYDINDPSVTPRQHITRAMDGPLFNLLLLPLALLVRRRTCPVSAARQVADVAAGTNAFLSSASFLPLPMIDGGPVLKWALVSRGRTPHEADEAVRKVNGAMSLPLALGGLFALRLRRYLIAIYLLLMALTSLGFARGWIREQ